MWPLGNLKPLFSDEKIVTSLRTSGRRGCRDVASLNPKTLFSRCTQGTTFKELKLHRTSGRWGGRDMASGDQLSLLLRLHLPPLPCCHRLPPLPLLMRYPPCHVLAPAPPRMTRPPCVRPPIRPVISVHLTAQISHSDRVGGWGLLPVPCRGLREALCRTGIRSPTVVVLRRSSHQPHVPHDTFEGENFGERPGCAPTVYSRHRTSLSSSLHLIFPSPPGPPSYSASCSSSSAPSSSTSSTSSWVMQEGRGNVSRTHP